MYRHLVFLIWVFLLPKCIGVHPDLSRASPLQPAYWIRYVKQSICPSWAAAWAAVIPSMDASLCTVAVLLASHSKHSRWPSCARNKKYKTSFINELLWYKSNMAAMSFVVVYSRCSFRTSKHSRWSAWARI